MTISTYLGKAAAKAGCSTSISPGRGGSAGPLEAGVVDTRLQDPSDGETDQDAHLQALLDAIPLDAGSAREPVDDGPSLFSRSPAPSSAPTWSPEPSGPPVRERPAPPPVPPPVTHDPTPEDEAAVEEMVEDLLAGVPAPASQVLRRQARSVARSTIRVQRLEDLVDRLHRTAGHSAEQCNVLHRKLAEMMMLLGGEIRMREMLWRTWSLAVAEVAPRVMKVKVLRERARRMAAGLS